MKVTSKTLRQFNDPLSIFLYHDNTNCMETM